MAAEFLAFVGAGLGTAALAKAYSASVPVCILAGIMGVGLRIGHVLAIRYCKNHP